jgi:two-component system, OmpR family, phosphate regulon response regulator PhoB
MAVKDNRIKVLIVDDDKCVRESVVFMLKEVGFIVQAAKDGQEALNKVTQDMPHIVVLDVAMPVMDGIETCKRLRANPGTRDIPVIFLSAQEHLEQLTAGLPGPLIRCLEKPCNIRCLAEEIQLAVLDSQDHTK